MTTDPRWVQARDLFLDLADLPEPERATELDRLAARDPDLATQVRDLLRHDRASKGPPGLAAPRRFGPYEAIRPIGAGGMGEVFVARRADGEYESQVAVKLLRVGTTSEELVRRFLRERQTLARLDHEYVARLLDGGSTEAGEPYLVMEYVDGEPADVFAARLGLRERLELFLRIGSAVAHAHERGFVHRDLKPSNILVRADGTPRLLDFGIARPDAETSYEVPDGGPLTRTGHRLFTPEYASPEQVRGELATVRSDVFALGVLLYVFLCGRGPWRATATLHELERSLCEDDPVPPSRLVTGTARRRLAGDLDAVVLQCLAKAPGRRYASVADLCGDLERHLTGLPVRARRTGTLGRVARFARRRPAYLVMAGLALLSLLAVGLALGLARRDRRHREELRAAVAGRIAASEVRWSGGEIEGAERELDAALAALRELPDDKALEAEVLVQKAVFASLQQKWQDSLALVARVRPLLEGLDAPDPRTVATLLNTRAFVLQRTEPGTRSRSASRIALEHARAHLPPGDVLRGDALLAEAEELRRGGDDEPALRLLEEAVAEVRQRSPKGEELSRFLNEKAIALVGMGRLPDAVACYREALDILTWNRGERHPSVAKVRLNLGVALFRAGELDAAKRELELSLAANRELHEELFVAASQHFLGRIHCAQGDYGAAEAEAREAIAIRERHGLELHVDRSRCLLGIVQARAGRPGEARATLAPLLAAATPESFLPAMEAEARYRLGAILDDAGDRAAARPHLVRALELMRALPAASDGAREEVRRRLGEH